MKIAKNIKELVYEWVGETFVKEEDAERFLKRMIFKFTKSGVAFWYDKEADLIKIVPYTEGFDGEHSPIILPFPIALNDFEEALDEADRIASLTWECVNEHPEDCECYLWI